MVVLASSLLSALVPVASVWADPTRVATVASTFTLDEEIKSLSYYSALNDGCIQHNMLASIQAKGTDNGNAPTSAWFDDNNAWGYVYPSGKTDCKDIVTSAMSLWKFSNNALFLAAIGYSYDTKSAVWSQPAGGESARLLAFELSINSNVYGYSSSSYRPSLSDAAIYIMASTYFRSSACSAQDLGIYSAISNPTLKSWVDTSTTFSAKDPAASVSGITKGSITYTKLTIVNQLKQTEDHGYVYQSSDKEIVGASKAGPLTTGGATFATLYGYHENPKTRTCADLVKDINANASKYTSWLAIPAHKQETVFTPGSACFIISSCGEPVNSCAINGVGWIVCPVINFMAGVADGAFNFLSNNFLKTDPKVLDTSPANGTFAAWSYMRTIANVVFVIVFLVIIFSQLTSMGISNYGVKKMIPRLIVAAILVNLSYFISQLAVDVSNILGFSIKNLFDGMTSNIAGSTSVNGLSTNPFNTGGGLAGVAGTVLATAIVGVAGYALISTFAPILIAAVLALVMILFILVARQVIIILLIVISPLAFVAFILPNTEKLFTQWRKMLTSMLLLFPIIALVFGASQLASQILTAANSFQDTLGSGGNVFAQIIASAVIVLPLFAVPVLLKKSLEGIPVLGQMASKFAGRANSNIGKRFGESYKGSLFGRGLAYRKAGAEAYRSRRFAERVKAGGKTGMVAGGIAITNAGRAGQRSLVKSAVQQSEKADLEEVAAAETLLRAQHLDPTELIEKAQISLTASIRAGDSVGARASQNVLLGGGGAGLKALQKTLVSNFPDVASQNNKVGNSLRTALNGAGLKSKNNVLARWAYSGNSIGETVTQAATYNTLSDVELGGQSVLNLKEAFSSGVLTADRAKEIVKNPVVFANMGADEKTFMKEVSDGPGFIGPANGTAAPTPSEPTEIDLRGSHTDELGRPTPDNSDEKYHDGMQR